MKMTSGSYLLAFWFPTLPLTRMQLLSCHLLAVTHGTLSASRAQVCLDLSDWFSGQRRNGIHGAAFGSRLE